MGRVGQTSSTATATTSDSSTAGFGIAGRVGYHSQECVSESDRFHGQEMSSSSQRTGRTHTLLTSDDLDLGLFTCHFFNSAIGH